MLGRYITTELLMIMLYMIGGVFFFPPKILAVIKLMNYCCAIPSDFCAVCHKEMNTEQSINILTV